MKSSALFRGKNETAHDTLGDVSDFNRLLLENLDFGEKNGVEIE